jgi:hypothetical protein
VVGDGARGDNLETFRTEIKLHQFYQEMKEPLAFDNFQDFIDHVIRLGLFQMQEGIVLKVNLKKKT